MTHRFASHALYLGLLGFLEVGSRVPPRLTRSLGRGLGQAAFRLSSKYRNRIRAHLEIAFPELDPSDRDAITADSARHFGTMLAEIAWLWRASPQDVESMCAIDGAEHLVTALEQGRGAMMITAHCGNWELLSARISVAGIPLSAPVRQMDEPRLDRLVTSMRTRFGTEICPRGPDVGRRLIRALHNNRVVGLLIDQDIGDIPGVFVPFFGRPAWTPTGAAMLALRRRCPVIPAFIHRCPDGTHRLEIQPPLPTPTAGSPELQIKELTAAATWSIEQQVRAHPEQWVWTHRRWRTVPPPTGSK